ILADTLSDNYGKTIYYFFAIPYPNGVFGVRSVLGWRLTFFLDDYVILLLGLTPVIPFYVIIQVMIDVFFCYAYICSLPIIDSIFNFFVGMVLTRAVAALFSDKKKIYDYLMEVDDESNLMPIDKDRGEVDIDTYELAKKHRFIHRFFAFLFFLNYSNGKFMWRQSLVGYVDKEQKFFTSKTNSMIIKYKKSVNIDLFGRGKIIKQSKDQKTPRYWSATLDIEDNRMYLVQKFEIQDIGVAFSGRVFRKNVQLFPNFYNKSSESSDKSKNESSELSDELMKITYHHGDFKEYLNDKNDDNYNWKLDINNSKLILLFDEKYKPKNSDTWNLKIKNNKAFITNTRLIDECEALNNNGKKAINLDRDVSLKGKWKIANQKIIHEKKSHDKYKIKKTILNDSPNNDKNLWEDKNLLVDGNSRLRIEKNGIYMEYKLIKENIKKAEAKINIDDKNEEIEIKDQMSKDNALHVGDYPFWDATLKKYESNIFLKHKINQENVISMSIEGKKLINSDIEDFKNEEDFKQNDNDNIINLTYSKIQYREILYRKGLAETFQSLTINNEVKITKEGDTIIIREIDNNWFRGICNYICNHIFSEKSKDKNVDEINKLEIKRKYWFREEKNQLEISVENINKKLAKIYILANSIIKIKNQDEIINHQDEIINHQDEIINHQDEIINHQDEIINHQDEIINHQDKIINHQDEIIKMKNGGKLKIESTQSDGLTI
ncbi:9150_t:CDS:2, partial [Scutellospora calospora]